MKVTQKEFPYSSQSERNSKMTSSRIRVCILQPAFSDFGYLTNETVFFLTELPKRLAIIGARLKKTSSVRLSAWRPSCSEWVAPLEQFSF